LEPPSPTAASKGVAADWWPAVSSAAARLEAAIKSGDAEEAARQARLLCERRVQLDIRPAPPPLAMPQQQEESPVVARRSLLDDGWFALPVALEGRGRPRQLLRLMARGDTRIGELRARVAARARDLPPGRQCWIAGGLLASDDRCLKDLGAVSETQPVHLYVLGDPQPAAAPEAPPAEEDAEPSPAVPAATVPVAMEPVAEQPQRTWDCPVCTFRNRWRRPGCEMCATERPESAPSSGASSDEKGSGLQSRESPGQRRRGHIGGLFRVLRPVPAAKQRQQQRQQQTGSGGRRICYSRDFLLSLQNCPLAAGKPGDLPRELLRSQKPPRLPVAGVTSQMNYAQPPLQLPFAARKRPPRGLVASRSGAKQTVGHRRPAQPPPCLQLVQDGSSSSD
ncbi:hypothetical protein BOX15_Mlig004010g1, partial [Macrostomum lignano]